MWNRCVVEGSTAMSIAAIRQLVLALLRKEGQDVRVCVPEAHGN
jgi:hypothetical protein